MLSRSIKALHDYKANRDPLAVLANTVALVVAGNQPFYPLYLHAIVGRPAWPAWITCSTTPLFAAVPAIAKRNSLAGRAMLPTIGTVNGILAVKLIGIDTGVELFLLPCVLLATIIFRPGRTARHARRVGPSRSSRTSCWMGPSARRSHRSTAAGTSRSSRSNGFSVASLFALITKLHVSIHHGT